MRRTSQRYEIIFLPSDQATPVVMHSALSADEATVLFAVELQRFLSDHTHGELAIRRKASRNAKPDVIIRQQLTSSFL